MYRYVALLVGLAGCLIVATSVRAATSNGTPVLVSGQSMIAFIDGNGDGPGPGDCDFSAFLTGSSLVLVPMQDINTPLRACAGACLGLASKGSGPTSNMGMVDIDRCLIPAGSLPVSLEWNDVTPNPSGTEPLRFDGPNDSISLSGGASATGALLCNAAGPAVRVGFPGGQVLLALSIVTDAQGQQFLKIPDLPLQTWTQSGPGGFTMLDAYLPVTPEGHLTAALSSDPQMLLVDVDLNGLPGCLGSKAPTLSDWGLILAMISLLAVAAWRLGLRPGFAHAVTAA